MKKSRVFTLGVACFFCAITALGFVPFTSTGGATSASNSGDLAALTQSADSAPAQGLITPHEDDPVLFTTENGIEIKIGNTVGIINRDLPMSSGWGNPNSNLKKFMYFTTYDNGTPYYWTIIGQSLSNSPFTFGNDPASIAIQSEAMYPIASTNEIPAGCVLCLANDIVETGVANTDNDGSVHYVFGQYSNNRAIAGYWIGTMYNVMQDYYLDGTFGLRSISDHIQPAELITYGAFPGDSGSSFYLSSHTVSSYIFPLASTAYANSFIYSTYLTNEQIKLSSTQWLRDGDTAGSSGAAYAHIDGCFTIYPYKRCINSEGTETHLATNNSTPGYRPAFCLEI
ncbi:MAG: hypothetical protein J6A98_02240 [Clostridia bacterium]|nr:hypothetical protein [Clostridia bacterium]